MGPRLLCEATPILPDPCYQAINGILIRPELKDRPIAMRQRELG